MIVAFFNKTKPINIVFLSILLVFFYIISIFYTPKIDFNELKIITIIKNLLLLLGSFWIINQIISENTLTNDSGYGILFYILLFGYFSMLFNDSNMITTHFFLLVAYRNIYGLRSDELPKQKLFNAGFWIGIASLFHPLSFLFLMLCFFAILMYNKDNWRFFILPILGFLLPIFLITSYYYIVFDSYLITESSLLITDFKISNYKNSFFTIPIIYILFIFIWSITSVSSIQSHDRNKFKESWVLLISHFILSFLILFSSPDKNGKEFILLFFPLSVIISNYTQKINKQWMKEVFLYGTIVLFVVVKFL